VMVESRTISSPVPLPTRFGMSYSTGVFDLLCKWVT
jgi:hypothetical protein